MIQITEEDYEKLKQLVEDSQPSTSVDSYTYQYICCGRYQRSNHEDDCPAMKWYTLSDFVVDLGREKS